MNSKVISFIRIGAVMALFSLMPLYFASAACSAPLQGSGTGIQNPLCVNTLDQAIYAVLGVIIQIGSIVLVIFFVYAGFNFVSAQGDPKKLETARHAFFGVVVGAAILIGAEALSQMIKNTLQPIMTAH